MNSLFMNQEKQHTNKINRSIIGSFYRAFKSFIIITPMLLGVILLLGLFRVFVSKEMISSFFTGNIILDTFIGSMVGSISAGNPITSYIIGGELLKVNVTLFAVTAFIVTWVTVGIIQFPFEVSIFGKRFAFVRNIVSFILSIFISIATVFTLLMTQ